MHAPRRRRRWLHMAMLVTLLVIATALPATARQPQLEAIRVAHHPGFDRVVFEFDGPMPSSHTVEYVSAIRQDGSGKRARVAGAALLKVTMHNALAHDDAGRSTVFGRRAYTTPNVLTVVRAGDFEGVVTYGIGLAKREPVRVMTLTAPNRLVIDIETTFRRVERKVWFLDRDAYATGTAPYRVAVKRSVPAAAPGAGVLHRLYAGPTPSERGAGLRLVRSATTGFSHLTIADQIADLRLKGRCDSGGATFTVADLIRPALKQFDSVSWVKIRDRSGTTQEPGGRRDSIPECLEP